MTVAKKESSSNIDLLENIESEIEEIWEDVSQNYDSLAGSLDEEFRPIINDSYDGSYEELIFHGNRYTARLKVDLDTGDRTYELQEENSGLLDKIGLTSPDLTQR